MTLGEFVYRSENPLFQFHYFGSTLFFIARIIYTTGTEIRCYTRFNTSNNKISCDCYVIRMH